MPFRWWTKLTLLTLVLAGSAVADKPVDTAADRKSEASTARQVLCGRLTEHEGLRVLELWGTPEQTGYAHGYLLAADIVRLMDEFVLSKTVMPDPMLHSTMLIPNVRRQFDWPNRAERELRSLLEGMRDRLGAANARSEVLGRTLELEDLMVANALADWFGMLCSTFSAWGSLTPDGQTITARNLDFPSTTAMEQLQFVMVYRGDGNARPWIGITWPGCVGVYTAMNSEGVTMLMHDANGLAPSDVSGFTPRAWILREALESASAPSFAEDVLKAFQSRRVLVGNNIHVSGPRIADHTPAVVFEYDANQRDHGVTVRGAAADEQVLADALWCTNHVRLRQPPEECWRFAKIEAELKRIAAGGTKLDPQHAINLIREAKLRTTLHTACFVPQQRKMFAYIPAVRDQVVEFRLDDWLSRAISPPTVLNADED